MIKIGRTVILAMALIFGLNSIAKKKADIGFFLKSFERYQKSAEVQFKVKKTLIQVALGKESNFDGKLFVSKGKFRFETNAPESALLVYDGMHLWSIEYSLDDSKTPPQVSKSKINKKDAGNFLFTLLFGEKSVDSGFDIHKVESNDQVEIYDLKPIKEISITDLRVQISKLGGLIDQISFVDDIGNKTILYFSETKFVASTNGKLFKFKVPKGAQVIEL